MRYRPLLCPRRIAPKPHPAAEGEEEAFKESARWFIVFHIQTGVGGLDARAARSHHRNQPHLPTRRLPCRQVAGRQNKKGLAKINSRGWRAGPVPCLGSGGCYTRWPGWCRRMRAGGSCVRRQDGHEYFDFPGVSAECCGPPGSFHDQNPWVLVLETREREHAS